MAIPEHPAAADLHRIPGPAPAPAAPARDRAARDLAAAAATGTAATGPETAVPVQTVLDDNDSPHDVIDALLIGRFANGDQPWARHVSIDRVKEDHPLLPDDARVLRSVRSKFRTSLLAEGDGWTLQTIRHRGAGRGDFRVTAVTDELAREVLERATDGARMEPVVKNDVVTMGFWYLSARHGPYRTTREISAQPWDAIRRNYAGGVAKAMDGLMALRPERIGGRLLLLHGPPGTGKTTALRALAGAWRSWCTVDCVLDPEQLFTDPGYLMDVAIGDDDDDDAGRWRLLLLEDCDELIRAGAKNATGQALSRLLNLTDGLLGQGRNILVGVTTNEEVERLHPAVVRPGRCLARVEIGPLSARESASWLGRSAGLGADGNTLAELFALEGDRAPVVVETEETGGGLYL